MRMSARFALPAALALAAFTATAATAQQPMPMHPDMPSTIRVTATGEARATPDRAWADFGVETEGATAQAAAAENAARMERIVAALVRAGVERANIQTSGYNVFPVYAETPRGVGEPQIRGYRVANTVSAQTDDVRGTGTLIDAALSAGANRVNGVRFGLRNPEQARAEAMRDALRRARAEAEVISGGLGVRLGRVLDASTASTPTVYPVMRRMEAAMADVASTPIEPGQQDVSAQITVVYAIEQ